MMECLIITNVTSSTWFAFCLIQQADSLNSSKEDSRRDNNFNILLLNTFSQQQYNHRDILSSNNTFTVASSLTVRREDWSFGGLWLWSCSRKDTGRNKRPPRSFSSLEAVLDLLVVLYPRGDSLHRHQPHSQPPSALILSIKQLLDIHPSVPVAFANSSEAPLT